MEKKKNEPREEISGRDDNSQKYNVPTTPQHITVLFLAKNVLKRREETKLRRQLTLKHMCESKLRTGFDESCDLHDYVVVYL